MNFQSNLKTAKSNLVNPFKLERCSMIKQIFPNTGRKTKYLFDHCKNIKALLSSLADFSMNLMK